MHGQKALRRGGYTKNDVCDRCVGHDNARERERETLRRMGSPRFCQENGVGPANGSPAHHGRNEVHCERFALRPRRPLPLLILHHRSRAALRMMTLPQTHPIIPNILGTFRRRKRHKSPLHRLTNAFNLDPRQLETITPVRHHTKWEPRVTLDIRGPSRSQHSGHRSRGIP